MHLVVKKNMTGRDDLAGALAPVREALLDSARAEAARIRAAADAAAEATVAAARDEADQIRAQARERGAADAATALGADRSRVPGPSPPRTAESSAPAVPGASTCL